MSTVTVLLDMIFIKWHQIEHTTIPTVWIGAMKIATVEPLVLGVTTVTSNLEIVEATLEKKIMSFCA